MPTTDADLDTLARTIWGEARGELRLGRIAVANVILNRVRDRRWPNSIDGVCRQRRQFSMWNEGDPNRDRALAVTSSDAHYREALFVAAGVLNGEWADPTFGATHYFNPAVAHPAWRHRLVHTATIGNHEFYV